MSVDYTKIQMVSSTSSNKVFAEDDGTFVVPVLPGIGEVTATATIPHTYGSDNLLFQVGTSNDVAGTAIQTVLPWASNDGRVIIYASLDANNLYITRINSDSSGFGFPATTVKYFYRLLVP